MSVDEWCWHMLINLRQHDSIISTHCLANLYEQHLNFPIRVLLAWKVHLGIHMFICEENVSADAGKPS
jgi:hypothetical protein